MIIRDIDFTLKDGRKALIRNPRDEDIEGMLDYLYVSSGETEFILRYPEECGKYTRKAKKPYSTESTRRIMRQCLFAWSKGELRETAILCGATESR